MKIFPSFVIVALALASFAADAPATKPAADTPEIAALRAAEIAKVERHIEKKKANFAYVSAGKVGANAQSSVQHAAFPSQKEKTAAVSKVQGELKALQERLAGLKNGSIAPKIPPTYKLKKGMTLEQAQQAVPGDWVLISERDDVQSWECRWQKPYGYTQRGESTVVVVATLELKNGTVEECETKPTAIKRMLEIRDEL